MNPLPFILKLVRNGLGLVIVFIDWVSRPKTIKRTEYEQNKAQAAVDNTALYQFFACPFCVKTRRAIHQLNVNIEARDINKQANFRAELEKEGGKVKVPCLRIEEAGQVRWMYESDQIIEYLQTTVAAA